MYARVCWVLPTYSVSLVEIDKIQLLLDCMVGYFRPHSAFGLLGAP